MSSASANSVEIRLKPQEGLPLERSEEQEMLMQIKGNIN